MPGRVPTKNFRASVRRIGLGLVALLLACEPSWTAPERRAREFIEVQVLAPTEVERLRAVANLPPDTPPDSVLGDLSARVSLNFLRARQAQGLTFKIVAGDTQRVDASRRVVTVHVTYLEPGTPVTGEVRFQVHVAQTDAGRWRIARVLGDN